MEEFARECHNKIMGLIFDHCKNPSHTLCEPTIKNIVGNTGFVAMKYCGLITLAGKNFNGIREYVIW